MGYMVICLSNIAMLHFSYKQKGIRPPAALNLHARELWELIKLCTFPDGRLCRIGGDTRARYCYCQDYALPMWLYVLDEFGDEESLEFERGWLEIVKKEAAVNGDGSFLGDRGGILRDKSPLYYTRLEADRAATLSMAAHWRRENPGTESQIESHKIPKSSVAENGNSWNDEFHGACLHRNENRITSWVWEAAEKPQGLCVPVGKSDMAEWRTNLFPNIIGTGALNTNEVVSHNETQFDGGFSTFGVVRSKTSQLLAEGQAEEVVAEQQLVFAALPDGATTICMQYAETPHRVYIETVQGLNLNMPNDIFNDDVRSYRSANSAFQTAPLPKNEETLELDSNWLMIDDSLFVEILYGGNITIHRSEKREICIKEKARGGGFLYVDEISSPYEKGLKPYEKGTVLVDL
ncbi:MAG: hypothetical protein KAG97_02420, partial [Victivallales bacterium]|nr:hypothetical protein [Victivallales bacterium]